MNPTNFTKTINFNKSETSAFSTFKKRDFRAFNSTGGHEKDDIKKSKTENSLTTLAQVALKNKPKFFGLFEERSPSSMNVTIELSLGTTLTKMDKIHSGNFGNIYRGILSKTISSEQNTIPVAIKFPAAASCKKEFDISNESLKNEIEIYKILQGHSADSNTCIAEMLESFQHDQWGFCMVQKIYKTNLYRYIIETPTITPFTVANVGLQIISALNFLSSFPQPIIHFDLKPENIFIESLEPLKIRVGDFGISRIGQLENDQEIKECLVTRNYRAPEVIFGLRLTQSVDMWSLGCILFEMQTKNYLFNTSNSNELLKQQVGLLGGFPVEYQHVLAKRISPENLAKIGCFFDPSKNSFLNFKESYEKTIEASCDDRYAEQKLSFKTFLAHIFLWDAEARITPDRALQDSYFHQVH